MSLALPILFLVALVGAIFACAKALWHAFGMLRGIRSSAEPWANLLPFIAFALPGVLDAQGQAHRAKFVVWAAAAIAFAMVAAIVQAVAGP